MTFVRSQHPSGSFVTIASDNSVGKSLRHYGEWSYGEIEAMRQFVARESNVIEVGANIGAHTLFIARDLCPEGLVFAFEPRRILFQMLCANMMLNGVSNVHATPCALGEEAGLLREGPLPVEEDWNFGAWALGQLSGEEEAMPIVPLDSMLGELPPIRLIKADVEGAELSVLKGAGALIARDRPIIYAENDRADLSRPLLSHVASLGYRIMWHYVALFRPGNFAGNPENVFGHTVSCNILCIPEEMPIGDLGLPPADDFDYHPTQDMPR